MNQYLELLEPLLFHILHGANSVIADRPISTTFRAFFIDEAWVFLKNPSIQRVLEALKTWRQANAAMVLSTQSLDELRPSDLLEVIIECRPNKISIPDLRIEYETREGNAARVNLELVTEHYRGRHAADKVHAGSSLYTPHCEADRLRRILDQRELTAEILSL
jgi:type IV secretory pathway VirB4 component